MTDFTRRRALLALACLALGPVGASAAPTQYTLRKEASSVGFQFYLSGVATRGTMPVKAADIIIDPNHLAASRVDVTLDVAKAKTAFFFATDALLSRDVLDAAQFPTIRFVSKSIQLASDGRLSGGASIRGLLTMRGVTRPITLTASVLRAPGSAADDLSDLTVRLNGAVSRSDFGATGYSDLVKDKVNLDILAVVSAN